MLRRKAVTEVAYGRCVRWMALANPHRYLRIAPWTNSDAGAAAIGMTVAGGITILMLSLHNEGDEQEQGHRYHNWFRLTERDDTRSQPAHGLL